MSIGGVMVSSETAIANLLGRYAEAIDSGRFEDAAALFTHARVRRTRPRVEELDAAGLLALWKDKIILYEDGTPRTKHVITNLIIDVDEDRRVATCRSCYTVYQQTDDFPLQVIAAGRYHDAFECRDSEWHFVYRDYSLLDLVGDRSSHDRRSGTVGQVNA
jgi:3-phenylpropionate/cinnamic acid dioxygenase small subunit